MVGWMRWSLGPRGNIISGKAGVGKPSCAASLAVKFANHSFSHTRAKRLIRKAFVRVRGVNSALLAKERWEHQYTDFRKKYLDFYQSVGLAEAFSFTIVNSFLESQEHMNFTRIVFDTPDTGRLLSVPKYMAQRVGESKEWLASAYSAGEHDSREFETNSEILDRIREWMTKASALMHDAATSKFIVVINPTDDFPDLDMIKLQNQMKALR